MSDSSCVCILLWGESPTSSPSPLTILNFVSFCFLPPPHPQSPLFSVACCAWVAVGVGTMYFYVCRHRISLKEIALILGTGRCEKKARPLSPRNPKLTCCLVIGSAKKRPPTGVGAIVVYTSTLEIGGRFFFSHQPVPNPSARVLPNKADKHVPKTRS